jgi:3-oxoadipate enol-lactonase
MQSVKVGGAWLHVEANLRPGGQNVVYINSLGSDLRIWDGVVARLASASFGALRFDLRGHGLSDLGTPPKLIADHAADLAAVMDAFGLGEAALCGVSVGGAVVLAFAAAQPARATRLALCNTGAKIGTAEIWNARIAAVERGGVATIADAVLERWFPPALRAADAPEVALARNMLSRTPATGYVATCAALRDSDLTEVARGVKVPALCVSGELDGSTPPAMLRELAGLVPGAAYHEIAGAGHLPCLQTPEALAERLIAFFK